MKGTDKSRALIASARRRRSLGVAMVEGAIVFPIMAGFLVLFELGHHSYEAYMQTGHVAEQRAWSAATVGSLIGNCPTDAARDDTSYKPSYFTMDGLGGGGNDSAGANPSIQQSSGGGIGGGGAGSAPGSGGWFMYHDTANATIPVARGNYSYTSKASSTSKVFCNQPYVGGLITIIQSAFHH